jgi:beta-lactamase superfamily II metal-dependent hydrolase
LRVLAVSQSGAVLLLEWDDFRALLPVGLDSESMEDLMTRSHPGQVAALLLAGSGWAELNPPGWIERWRPQVALLSAAADDFSGRPDAETLKALRGYTLLRTDRNGWIELSTDGELLWVEVERR